MKVTPFQFYSKLSTLYFIINYLLGFIMVYALEGLFKEYVVLINSILLIFVPILSTLLLFRQTKKDIPKYEVKTTKLAEIENIVKEFGRIEKISIIRFHNPDFQPSPFAATRLYSPIDYFRRKAKGYLILDIGLTSPEGMEIIEPIMYHEIGHIVLNHHKVGILYTEKIYQRILLLLSVTLSFITNTIFPILIVDIICIVLIQIFKSYRHILLEAEADHFMTRYYKGSLEDYYMSCRRSINNALLPQKIKNSINKEFRLREELVTKKTSAY